MRSIIPASVMEEMLAWDLLGIRDDMGNYPDDHVFVSSYSSLWDEYGAREKA